MSTTQSTDLESNAHESAVKDKVPMSADSQPSATPTRRPGRLHDVKTKSLTQFADFQHLAHTMVGAITAHKRLYEDAGYIHGDVSTNTIIILKHPNGETEGALIDYDLPLNPASQRKKYHPDIATLGHQPRINYPPIRLF